VQYNIEVERRKKKKKKFNELSERTNEQCNEPNRTEPNRTEPN
jgi:hypothetical protein